MNIDEYLRSVSREIVLEELNKATTTKSEEVYVECFGFKWKKLGPDEIIFNGDRYSNVEGDLTQAHNYATESRGMKVSDAKLKFGKSREWYRRIN